MASHKGFQYEINAYNELSKIGIVPDWSVPSGANSDNPDLILYHNQKTAGCELKIKAASAGSLVLKYDISDTDNPWKFNEIKPENAEKILLRDLAHQVDVFSIIKKQWKTIPLKREMDEVWYKEVGHLSCKERYYIDKENFTEIIGEIPTTKVEDYYNKKNSWYINVGTHGLYLLGKENPLELKGVPKFSESSVTSYRARVQYKRRYSYQFTFEMQFYMKDKSPYNIAPVNLKTASIIKDKMNLDCFA